MWLSVDFDFFVRESPMWDWGHVESVLHREILWASRAMGFPDISDEMSPEIWASPKPEGFLDALEKKGVTLAPDCGIVVSDSHTYGIMTFATTMDVQETLLSFDAHHDLGYELAKFKSKLKSGMISCEDWLGHLLVMRSDLSAQIIYPDWKKEWLDEWKEIERIQSEKIRDISRAYKQAKSSLWSECELPEGEITTVHICRSGSWVPPWLDPQFISFVQTFEDKTGNTADLAYLSQENCNPLEPRAWDWGPIEQMNEQMKSQFEHMNR